MSHSSDVIAVLAYVSVQFLHVIRHRNEHLKYFSVVPHVAVLFFCSPLDLVYARKSTIKVSIVYLYFLYYFIDKNVWKW